MNLAHVPRQARPVGKVQLADVATQLDQLVGVVDVIDDGRPRCADILALVARVVSLPKAMIPPLVLRHLLLLVSRKVAHETGLDWRRLFGLGRSRLFDLVDRRRQPFRLGFRRLFKLFRRR